MTEKHHVDYGFLFSRNLIPFVGMKFLHKRVLDGNYQPATYVVTKIQEGIVYYKQPDEKKAKQCSYLGEFMSKYFLKEI